MIKRALFLALALLTLCSCGYRGALVLPEAPTTAAPEQSENTPDESGAK